MVWLSYYRRPAVRFKQKTHRHPAVGLINFVNASKPDCRAGQQRVRKQQVQITIHAGKISAVTVQVKLTSPPVAPHFADSA